MPSLTAQLTVGYIGSLFNSLLYGCYIVLTGANIHLLRRKRHVPRLYLVYTIALFVTTTLYWAASVAQSQMVLIQEPTDPQNIPPSFINISILADVMPVINFWLVGLLLVYRCLVVWNRDWRVAAVLAFLYLSSIGTGIYSIWAEVHLDLAGTLTAQKPFWSFLIALNVTAAALITSRLLYYKRRLHGIFGGRHGKHYTSIIALVVESTALDVLFEILAFATLVNNSDAASFFLPVEGMILPIVPNLVIYRVATGVSFESEDHDTVAAPSTQFTSNRTAVVNVSVGKELNSSSSFVPSLNGKDSLSRNMSSAA